MYILQRYWSYLQTLLLQLTDFLGAWSLVEVLDVVIVGCLVVWFSVITVGGELRGFLAVARGPFGFRGYWVVVMMTGGLRWQGYGIR
jgi:hypothetical protein